MMDWNKMSYLNNNHPSPGLHVLITAGAAGIGAEIARAFLETGARVMICDVDKAALARFAQDHPQVATCVADVSDAAAVERMFEQVKADFGRLDVLINNAGVAGPTGDIEDLDLADIRKTLEIDLLGQFIVVKAAAPLIKASDSGVIINMSSVAGRLGYAMRTPYVASKWGIVGLTDSLAKEMGPDGVRVNAVLPGIVQGDRINNVIRDRAKAAGVSFEEMEKEILSNVSLRRMVQAKDIAATVLFLCSPGGANISGQAISVCGNVETL